VTGGLVTDREAVEDRVPWNESCLVKERMSFLTQVNESDESFAALCRQYGISRKTGYKWVNRFEQEQDKSLLNRHPLAASHPCRVPDVVVDAIVAARKEHPYWGPKKLKAWLTQTRPEQAWPASSTIGDKLEDHGLIRPRRRRIRVPMSLDPLAPVGHANETWCVDFKGHFELGDKTRCYPLTVTDQYSRYLLKCEGLAEPKFEPVKAQFELSFAEFGLPQRIRSDNGPPFASVAVGGLSKLSVWWIQLGIAPERIEPGKPQQNGRHERMHRTLKQETANPPSHSMVEQQRIFDRFRGVFNGERPHEALGQKPPSSRYCTSARPLRKLEPPVYPPSMKVHRIDAAGRLKFFGRQYLLTLALAGQPVGLEPIDEDTWELYYGPILLAEMHVRNKQARLERVG
jgi:putative transposase